MWSKVHFKYIHSNVCFKKSGTKQSSVLLMRFVPVFLKQTLYLNKVAWKPQNFLIAPSNIEARWALIPICDSWNFQFFAWWSPSSWAFYQSRKQKKHPTIYASVATSILRKSRTFAWLGSTACYFHYFLWMPYRNFISMYLLPEFFI